MLSLVFFMASAKELEKNVSLIFFLDRLLVTKYLKIQLKYHTSYADTTLVYSLSWVTQGCLKAWPKKPKKSGVGRGVAQNVCTVLYETHSVAEM